MNSNTQMIQKGRISTIEPPLDRNGDNTTARVIPCTAEGLVTRALTIPWHLRGSMGELAVGMEVAYAMFEDGTGVILSRMDGEWSGTIPGDVHIQKGTLTIDDQGIEVPKGDVLAKQISLCTHIHPIKGKLTDLPQ